MKRGTLIAAEFCLTCTPEIIKLWKNKGNKIPQAITVRTSSDLDFGVILEGLLLNPESYVNFGEYWWTTKRMLADWAEENGPEVDPNRLRGTLPPHAVEVEDSEIYRFLDRFSGRDDFIDWISYVNPAPVWDDSEEDYTIIEDLEWEEYFL